MNATMKPSTPFVFYVSLMGFYFQGRLTLAYITAVDTAQFSDDPVKDLLLRQSTEYVMKRGADVSC